MTPENVIEFLCLQSENELGYYKGVVEALLIKARIEKLKEVREK